MCANHHPERSERDANRAFEEGSKFNPLVRCLQAYGMLIF